MKKPKIIKAKTISPDRKRRDQMYILNQICKIELKPSRIDGVGVFAMRNIKKGEKLNADAMYQAFDLKLEDVKKLRPEVSKKILGSFPLIWKGSHFFYPTTSFICFMNHSSEPNYDGKTDLALRDIKKGEEITEDYKQIDGWEKVIDWLD